MAMVQTHLTDSNFYLDSICKQHCSNMDELLSNLNDVLKHVQALLHEGMPSIDANADCLPWLNVSCILLLSMLD